MGFDLERFVTAQASVYHEALRELERGRKETHWMWFIFPQIAGLGKSAMAERYALQSLAEARAYAGHPVLGPRLRACSRALLPWKSKSLHEILGSPDDMKFRSSMTLFQAACPDEHLFAELLVSFCDGQSDARTLELIR